MVLSHATANLTPCYAFYCPTVTVSVSGPSIHEPATVVVTHQFPPASQTFSIAPTTTEANPGFLLGTATDPAPGK